MSEKREQMLDAMIRVYGHEHRLTIEFARLLENCDETKDMMLEQLLKAHQECPILDDDEEE